MIKSKLQIKLPSGLKQLLLVSSLVLAFMIIIPMIVVKSSAKTTEDISQQTGDSTENTNTNVTEDKLKPIEVKGGETIQVYLLNEDKVVEVPLEDYVTSVVSSEMPAGFNEEALKAQAVAARTFVIKRKINHCPKATKGEICDSVHCQVYMSKDERLAKWDNNLKEEYWNKIDSAVKATKGQVLSYNNKLVENPQFFSTSSGKTENAIDVFSNEVPYLVSIESKGEEVAPKYTSDVTMTIDDFVYTINSSYQKAGLTVDNIENSISIKNRSEAGGVKEIKVGGETIKGTDFRFLLKLNSTNFEYKIDGNNIIFSCKGYGHGVGMSQWGANVMGKDGKGYLEILKHYYTGVEVVDLKFK